MSQFTGGPAAAVSGEDFSRYEKNEIADSRDPDRDGAVERAQMPKIDRIMSNAILQQAQQNGMQGNGFMPPQNMNQTAGYQGLQNPGAFQKATILPFDTNQDPARNFAGIVNSYDPRLYKASEDMMAQITSMAPQARNALAYKGSIYTGNSGNFQQNMLYIMNTRIREQSIYAFI